MGCDWRSRYYWSDIIQNVFQAKYFFLLGLLLKEKELFEDSLEALRLVSDFHCRLTSSSKWSFWNLKLRNSYQTWKTEESRIEIGVVHSLVGSYRKTDPVALRRLTSKTALRQKTFHFMRTGQFSKGKELFFINLIRWKSHQSEMRKYEKLLKRVIELLNDMDLTQTLSCFVEFQNAEFKLLV